MWDCFYILLLSCLSSITSKQIPLIGLFISDDQESNHSSSSLIIDYALNHFKTIKNLQTELVIQRYEQDIPCDMAIGTKMIFDMIHRQPRPLAIFSGSCQTVASAIAETAGIFDMTIVGNRFDFNCNFSFSVDYLFRNKFTLYGERKISIVNSNGPW